MKTRTRRKVVFEHDSDPDFSWLEQDCFKSEPTYRTRADMKAKRNPISAEWYANPDNHVALSMLVYELTPDAEDWTLVDSLGNIDFFADGNDWKTGTFYHLRELNGCPYLKSLAKDAKLPR